MNVYMHMYTCIYMSLARTGAGVCVRSSSESHACHAEDFGRSCGTNNYQHSSLACASFLRVYSVASGRRVWDNCAHQYPNPATHTSRASRLSAQWARNSKRVTWTPGTEARMRVKSHSSLRTAAWRVLAADASPLVSHACASHRRPCC